MDMQESAATPRRIGLAAPAVIRSLPVVMAVVLFTATLAAVLARMLTHTLRIAVDDWAYTVWGQAIASGDRPRVEYLLTAPKPLAYVFGTLVAPFSPGYGVAIVIAGFGAALVALIALAVRKEAGLLGVPVALGLLAFTEGFRYNTQRGSADLIPAAFVVGALLVRGRWRIALLVAAGLMRPEVWPLVAVAAFLEATGTVPRRLALGALAGLVAPALWVLTDLAANGRPFMFIEIGEEAETFTASGGNYGDLPSGLYEALSGNVWPVVIVLGAAGLILHTVRTHRAGRLDALPLAAAVLLAAGVAAEIWQGLPPYPRYTTSVAALLLVGTGWLAGFARPNLDGRLPGTVIAAGSALMIGVAVTFYPVRYPYERPPHVERAVPAIEQARQCGQISVTGSDHRRNPILSMLAALGRMPLSAFSPFEERAWRTSGAVLRVYPEPDHPGLRRTPPWASQNARGWVRMTTSVGQLWLTGDCVARGGVVEGARAVPVTPAGSTS